MGCSGTWSYLSPFYVLFTANLIDEDGKSIFDVVIYRQNCALGWAIGNAWLIMGGQVNSMYHNTLRGTILVDGVTGFLLPNHKAGGRLVHWWWQQQTDLTCHSDNSYNQKKTHEETGCTHLLDNAVGAFVRTHFAWLWGRLCALLLLTKRTMSTTKGPQLYSAWWQWAIYKCTSWKSNGVIHCPV